MAHRYKFYAAETGTAYQYFFAGSRRVNRPEGQGAGSDYIFVVSAQGGDPRVADEPASVLPRATMSRDIPAMSSGFVGRIDALVVGEAARALGAGRQRKGDAIDYAAGIMLRVKVGARAETGKPWATAYASDDGRLDVGARLLESAVAISEAKPDEAPLIYGSVDRRSHETRYR